MSRWSDFQPDPEDNDPRVDRAEQERACPDPTENRDYLIENYPQGFGDDPW